jgi:predicted O-methyltransferase YrrM
MAVDGTAAHDRYGDLPPLVANAVAAARRAGFTTSCLPQQGRLLQVLARGVGAGKIGETGTGYGTGLAWMVSAAHPDARIVSIEHDPRRAQDALLVFANDPRVHIICGDWRELVREAPFDLLVLDGGGQGKGSQAPLEPGDWMLPGGLIVMDDFTPMTTWPPTHGGQPDHARMHWLQHPRMRATEVRVTPTTASLLGLYTG